MATNMMDKGMYAAPIGLGMESMEPDLEIEIENPDAVTLSDGSMEITLEPGDEKQDGEFGANLAEEMDEGELANLASDLLE